MPHIVLSGAQRARVAPSAPSRSSSSLRWPLLGATAAALVVAGVAGASHGGGVDPVALHVGFTNSTTLSTTHNCTSTASCLRVDNMNTGNGARAIRGVHSAASGAAPAIEGITAATSYGSLGILGSVAVAPGGSSIDSAGVKGTNSGTMGGVGVWGEHAGDGTGVGGRAKSGFGVEGIVSSAATGDIGVWGRIEATAATGTSGVTGTNFGSSPDGYGVLGEHTSSGTGVAGRTVTGAGVLGQHSGSGVLPGVKGTTSSGTDLAAGVYGESQAGTLTSGVHGSSTAFGVLGVGGTAGVLGYSAAGLAGLFAGDVHVTGTLTKGAGAFRIDNPLDPQHKYLQHSFVESPDMKNVYDGVVTTDRRGYATVRLPRYFGALNRDFRYQLTIVGARGWRARVVSEIARNRFTIQSDEPRVKVSWQVTGIRKDAYANAHRIDVEIAKTAADRHATGLASRLLRTRR
jgi:hypothetical protein